MNKLNFVTIANDLQKQNIDCFSVIDSPNHGLGRRYIYARTENDDLALIYIFSSFGEFYEMRFEYVHDFDELFYEKVVKNATTGYYTNIVYWKGNNKVKITF